MLEDWFQENTNHSLSEFFGSNQCVKYLEEASELLLCAASFQSVNDVYRIAKSFNDYQIMVYLYLYLALFFSLLFFCVFVCSLHFCVVFSTF